jgi:hypothetical protein
VYTLLNPVVDTHSLKAPGDPTLEPYKVKKPVSKFVISNGSTCTALRHGVDLVLPRPPGEARRGDVRGGEAVVGLYKLNPVYPYLESAWFQPLSTET